MERGGLRSANALVGAVVVRRHTTRDLFVGLSHGARATAGAAAAADDRLGAIGATGADSIAGGVGGGLAGAGTASGAVESGNAGVYAGCGRLLKFGCMSRCLVCMPRGGA